MLQWLVTSAFWKVILLVGRVVTVTVDRPLGSTHPTHKDIVYPVNYGYVEGMPAPDGEWQDAYILGAEKPVTEFTGDNRFGDFVRRKAFAGRGNHPFVLNIVKAADYGDYFAGKFGDGMQPRLPLGPCMRA